MQIVIKFSDASIFVFSELYSAVFFNYFSRIYSLWTFMTQTITFISRKTFFAFLRMLKRYYNLPWKLDIYVLYVFCKRWSSFWFRIICFLLLKKIDIYVIITQYFYAIFNFIIFTFISIILWHRKRERERGHINN